MTRSLRIYIATWGTVGLLSIVVFAIIHGRWWLDMRVSDIIVGFVGLAMFAAVFVPMFWDDGAYSSPRSRQSRRIPKPKPGQWNRWPESPPTGTTLSGPCLICGETVDLVVGEYYYKHPTLEGVYKKNRRPTCNVTHRVGCSVFDLDDAERERYLFAAVGLDMPPCSELDGNDRLANGAACAPLASNSD